MAFGISFGSKKSSMIQDSTINKTETGSQTGSSQNAQTTTQNSSTTGSQSSQSQNAQDQSSASTANTTGSSTQQQTQQTQTFSDQTLAGLEGVVSKLLGGVGSKAESISSFNPTDFVNQGMASAAARAQSSIDEATGGIFDAIGGRNNSAAALLQQRVNNDSNANLAGTQANLTAQAEEIQRNNLLAGNTMAATNNDLITNLLQTLKGGITGTTGTAVEQTAQQQATQAQQSSAGTESQQQQSASETQATEKLASLLTQLLSTVTNTTGTEHTTGSTKGSGFGISASL